MVQKSVPLKKKSLSHQLAAVQKIWRANHGRIKLTIDRLTLLRHSKGAAIQE